MEQDSAKMKDGDTGETNDERPSMPWHTRDASGSSGAPVIMAMPGQDLGRAFLISLLFCTRISNLINFQGKYGNIFPVKTSTYIVNIMAISAITGVDSPLR